MHVHEFQPWFPFPSALTQPFVKVIVTVQLRPVFNHAQQIMQKIKSIRKKDIKASAMQGEKEKDYETKKLNTACTKKLFLIVVANLHIFLLFSYNIVQNVIKLIIPHRWKWIFRTVIFNISNHNLLCLTCLHTVQCIIILSYYEWW